jgi:NADH-quinone oxidoreductase subunit M
MPVYAVIFMVFTMANVGLPGTSGFVGEFLTLLGAFKASTKVAFLATTGVILSACYALWLYWQVIWGELTKPALKAITDVDRREITILAPLVVLTVLLGVYPTVVLSTSEVAVNALVESYNQAITAGGRTAAVMPR